MTTPIYNVREINESQNLKENTHNNRLRDFEPILGRAVLDFATSEPVATNGDVYVVVSPATSLFTGKEDHFAYFESSEWRFVPIQANQNIFNVADNQKYFFNGTAWVNVHDLPVQTVVTMAITGIPNVTYLLDTVSSFTLPLGNESGDRIRIVDYSGTFGTTPLIVNRTAPNTIDDNSSTTATLSTAYSVTDFIYDNNIWRQIRGITGLSAGTGFQAYGDVLSADVDYYVDAGTGNDSNDGSMGSPFLTIQKALDTLSPRYLKVHDVNIYLNGTFNITDANRIILEDYRNITGKVTLRGNSVGAATLSAQAGFTQEGNNAGDGGVITIVNNSIWQLSDLIISTASAGSTNAIGIKLLNSQAQIFGTIEFNDGSTGGTDCIVLDKESNASIYELSGGTTQIRFTATSNFVRRGFFVDNESTIFIQRDVEIDFNASNNIVASGAFMYGRNSSGIVNDCTYLGSLQGTGFRYDLDLLSSIVRKVNPPGALTTDSILNFSEVYTPFSPP